MKRSFLAVNYIKADLSGNVYLTGVTGGLSQGREPHDFLDYFITKYSESGNLIWTRQVGESSTNPMLIARALSIDRNGNVYIAGDTTAGMFNQQQHGYNDYFIVKYGKDGHLLWSKQVGASAGNTYGYGLGSDSKGNAYVAGFTNVGISGQTQNGSFDYYIAKYNESGNLLWTKQVGKSGQYVVCFKASVDSNDNVYITGYTNFGLSGQTQNGLSDYFIAKYNDMGSIVWSTQFGREESYGVTDGNGISVDLNGNIYMAGDTNVNPSDQTQHGNIDYVLAKYLP